MYSDKYTNTHTRAHIKSRRALDTVCTRACTIRNSSLRLRRRTGSGISENDKEMYTFYNIPPTTYRRRCSRILFVYT
jgi:hypothetical protein